MHILQDCQSQHQNHQYGITALVHHSSHQVIGLISQPSCTKAVKTAVLLDHLENPKWALAKPNTTRFTYWQRKFVFDAFMEGEETETKSTPEKVVLMMRNLKHTDDGKFLKPEEFITKNQIQSLFSTMSQQRRAQKLQALNTNKKKKWNIHTKSNDYEESDDNDERMDVAENYLKLKMNDVVCVSIANERKKKSFS